MRIKCTGQEYKAEVINAGFGEVVDVDATATDGWSRQNAYDASAVRAFVLGPVGFDA